MSTEDDCREAVHIERERWLRWASAHACCEAGLVAAPDLCPWHDRVDVVPLKSHGRS